MTLPVADRGTIRVDLPDLPRETTPRFVLAALALLVSSVAIAEALWYGFHLDYAAKLLTEICLQPDRSECLAGDRARIIWTVTALPLAVLAALVIAVASSAYRRSRLKPLNTAATEVMSAECAAEFNTRTAPILWRIDRPVSNARADGMLRRYIEVGPNWLTWSVADKEKAAAVLRHEYAHHRSRDVIVARWTVALSVVVAMMAIALLIQSAMNSTLRTVAVVTLQIAGILLVAALSRSAVLRAREFEADRYAAVGSADALRQVLMSPLPTPVRARWLSAFAHHPTPDQRLASVGSPSVAHRPRVADGILVGLTASIGAPVISRLLTQWAGRSAWGLYASGIAWALVGVAVACWLAVTVWNYTTVNRRDDDTDVAPPIRFAIALGIAMIVGNIAFSNPLMLASVAIPHHTVDVATAVFMSAALPAGTLWMAQLFGRVVRPDSFALSLFRGWGIVAAVVGIVMTTSLMAFSAFMNTLALIVTAGAEQSFGVAVEPDSPFEVFGVARIWNSEWMGAVLPSAALAGLLVALICSQLARRQWKVLVLGVIGASVLAVTVLELLTGPFEIIHRAKDAGWFAAGRVIDLMFATVGISVAVAALCVVSFVPVGRVVFAGGIAALSGCIAILATNALQRGVETMLDPSAVEVIPVSVLLTIALACLLGSRPIARAGRAFVILGGLAAVAITATLCVHAASSMPTVAQDVNHYKAEMGLLAADLPGNGNQGPLFLAAGLCSGPVTAESAGLVAATVEDFSSVSMRPVTPELRRIHDELIDTLATCRGALSTAQARGQTSLSADRSMEINRALDHYANAFLDLDKRVNGR